MWWPALDPTGCRMLAIAPCCCCRCRSLLVTHHTLSLLPCPAAEAAAARRRAAAMCQIAGVGEVGAEEPHPAAMQAAMNEVRSGAAFRDSPFADGVSDLVRAQQGGS